MMGLVKLLLQVNLFLAVCFLTQVSSLDEGIDYVVDALTTISLTEKMVCVRWLWNDQLSCERFLMSFEPLLS
ncbi:hypothetical protein DPMN_192304 [Dreissena polymorpha]|uniref:Secreted protein n=1 Tax=Dreissena polymorpha TaxID=45954 RepID=A0A9D4BEI4_DREPO|nr:hypothetical protein DPMN_192304 [Dreissena polymorpha]